jgi:inner membrane protein YidH
MSTDDQGIRQQAERDVDPRLDLAVERTLLALERTQLSWIRTALGLLAAAVAMDKGLEALHHARVAAGHALVRHAHVASLALIAVTLVLFAGATAGYHRREHRLATLARTSSTEIRWILWQSLFLLVLGIVIFALLWLDQPLLPRA